MARSVQMARWRKNISVATIAILSAGAATTGAANAAVEAFAQLAGTWSGGGRAYMENGSVEPVRCRAHYDVSEGGRALHQALRCASASTALDVQSDDMDRGGKISGTWIEPSRNVGGELSGVATGRRIRAEVRGENFAANLSIVTDRDKQSIVITPEGSNVRQVEISLQRR
jgi:hypothetical protein